MKKKKRIIHKHFSKIHRIYLFVIIFILGVIVTIAIQSNGKKIGFNVANVYANAIYPPDTTLSYVAQPTVARPGYLSPIIDPSFGTTVTRISDQTAFNTTALHMRHKYSRNQPWNSDGTLILLANSFTGYVVDGNTYQYIRSLNLGDNQTIWSNTNPNIIYDRNGNQMITINPRTGVETVIHTFTEFDSISYGDAEGNLSNDDHYLVVQGTKSSAVSIDVYDMVNNQVVARKDFGITTDLDWASMSQSGNYVVVSWVPNGSGPSQGVDVYDRNLTFLRHIENDSEHADLGYDAFGNEVYVSLSYNASGELASVNAIRLDNGSVTRISHSNWTGTHVSCRNLNRPGWCYISDSHADKPDHIGYNEVFAIKLDGSGTIERFAHLHQSQNISDNASKALAAANRDGTRVMWGSDWEGGSTAPGYAYVAEYKVSSTSTPTPTILVPTNTPTPSPTPVSSDTMPPTLTITNPLNNSTVKHNTTVQILASASDNIGVTKVEFYVNNVLTCPADTTSPYSCNWIVPSKVGVTYIITAKAYDAANNITSKSVQVTSVK